MGGPRFKEIGRVYGFDEVAIAPGPVTINPEQANTTMTIGDRGFSMPILGSSMDAVVAPDSAIRLGQAGGLGVLNLEGLWTRYEDADGVLAELAETPQEKVTALLQKLYSAPIRDDLVGRRVQEIKEGGVTCAVAVTPQRTKRLSPLAIEAGADILVVQATVTTARHISKSYRGLIFSELVASVDVPVVVGNCATYPVALELMETGISGVLVGIGPGAACTTREVVGVGIPQVSATIECAAAREEYLQRTGRYVTVVTDGGIRTGGDLCKALVAGADGVMLGTPLAQATESPGRGFNWGMATPDPALPRGIRIRVGTRGTMEEILTGPSSRTDGTMNLIGALRACMGMVGASSIRELQQAGLVYAPDIKMEGKAFQIAQSM